VIERAEARSRLARIFREPLVFWPMLLLGLPLLLYLALSAPLPFLRVLWDGSEADPGDFFAARQRMADGLLLTGRLDGRTAKEVEELLGPARNTGYFKDFDLVYKLGDERGAFSIDSEWLVIRLGPDGRVAEARLARD
jgi:hypothetical protein